MTNLEAMQDEQLLETIRDVEKLERLHYQVGGNLCNADFQDHVLELESDIQELKNLIRKRWKKLMEEE